MRSSERVFVSIILTAVVFSSSPARADQCLELFSAPVSTSVEAVIPVKELSFWRRLALKYELLKADLILRGNQFRTNRPLREGDQGVAAMGPGSYESYLWSGFLADLKNLKSSQHWIDIGSGEGQAIRDYYSDAVFVEKARVTGISVQPPNDQNLASLKKASNGFRSRTGRLLETYSANELERADLITDVMGALHYSRQLDLTLAKELELLIVGGRLYTQVPDGTRFYLGKREISWLEFLSRVQGIRLVEVPGDQETFKSDFKSLAIQRISERVLVPKLKLIKFKAGEPPTRSFQLLN